MTKSIEQIKVKAVTNLENHAREVFAEVRDQIKVIFDGLRAANARLAEEQRLAKLLKEDRAQMAAERREAMIKGASKTWKRRYLKGYLLEKKRKAAAHARAAKAAKNAA